MVRALQEFGTTLQSGGKEFEGGVHRISLVQSNMSGCHRLEILCFPASAQALVRSPAHPKRLIGGVPGLLCIVGLSCCPLVRPYGSETHSGDAEGDVEPILIHTCPDCPDVASLFCLELMSHLEHPCVM